MIRSIRILGVVAVAVGIGLVQAVHAGDSPGENTYQHCNSCHGAAGQGGERGKYPRIAALPQAYIERQLQNFKWRKRVNKPMVPVFKSGHFNEDAMEEVAAYLTQLPEPALKPYQPSVGILADFDSRQEFDDLGKEYFEENCDQCHGEDGRGRADKEAPPLVNQYPAYIRKQIGDFAAGRREHEHAAKMFGEMYEEELESLLVHLGRLSKGVGGG